MNLVALLDRVETVAAANGTAWVGKVSGDDDSQVILAVSDGVLSASVSAAGRLYSVRRESGGTYTIAEVNASAIPPGGEPIVPKLDAPAADAAAVAPADSGDTFDLLLYYTTTTKNAAGGTAAIKALVTATIAQTNALYQASGIGARVRLVGALEMNYAETGSLFTDLPAIRANATAQADRNLLGADLVSLLVSSNSSNSGLAYTMGSTSVNQTFESAAYSTVVYYSYIGFIYALAHEMGHNMGCLHEPGNNSGDDTHGAFLYSLGYTDPVHKFYDVMSYGLNCTGCTQMNQFSSATNTYQGFPSGTATQDNARTINNTRTTVANFRQSVTGALGAPSNLFASSSGSNITLTWSAGSGQPTGYLIEAGSSSGKADLASLNTGNASTTFSASGIANGLYYVRVSPTSGSTTGLASNEAVLQVGACSSAPPAPTNLNVAITGSTFVIAWTPSSRATSYILDAGSSAGASNLAAAYDITNAVVSVPGGNQVGGYPNQLSWSYSPLPAGSYYLRLRGRNACGTSAASNETVVVVR
ncbi:MAG: hypothetical protein HY047_13270 [Acidobacteria bacterium]|nr:hypothetical protein [Acidobacteriota bacterium]